MLLQHVIGIIHRLLFKFVLNHGKHQFKAAASMSNAKGFFSLCVVLIGLGMGEAQDALVSTPVVAEGLKGNCSCGGFPTSTPEVGSTPILSQSPGLVVNCDEEGSATCKKLCFALATATKAKGPEILCNRLENAEELKLSAFYRICEKPWIYADMTAEEALCCQDSKVKVCASADRGTTTAANIKD